MPGPRRSSACTADGKRAATGKASTKASAKTSRKAAKAADKSARAGGNPAKAAGKSAKAAGKSMAGAMAGAGKVVQLTARGAGKATQGSARGAGKAATQTARGAGKAVRAGTAMAANRAARSARREVNSRTRATRAWWRGLRRGLKARPRRLVVVNAGAPQLTAAALGGAGIAFLLDPANGKRRRKVAVDRTMAVARRTARRGAQKADYAAGKAQGAVHEATSSPSPPDDDRTLADRVRTEIFRPADAPSGAVNVSAVDGNVYLRGEIADEAEIERLVSATLAIPGVLRVENLLHTPGTPAPTGGAG